MRPLISTGDPKKSVDISRKAELYETSSGMITITGGKLTTWRRMAQSAVDRIVEREGREAPCRTTEIQLGMPLAPGELDGYPQLDDDVRAHLAARYGHAAVDVMRMAEGDPELSERIVPDLPDLLVEAPFAARPRAGALAGGRAASPHPARAAGRAHPVRAGLAAGPPGGRGDGGRAGLGRRGAWTRSSSLWARVSALEGLVPGEPVPEPAA